MNANNKLVSLAETQLNQLYDWLQVHTQADVQQKVAQPPPEGFGIEVSIDSLSRFFRRRRAEARAADAIAISQCPPAPSTANFHEAASQSFAHLTYEAADSPAAAKNFIHLSNWFARRDHNEIKRQFLEVSKLQAQLAAERLQLERERHHLQMWKAQFNLARLSLEHVAKLRAVLNDETTDDQEKIDLAHQIICGPNAVPNPFEPMPKPQ